MPASRLPPLTFTLPPARNFYREGAATLGGQQRLASGQMGLQAEFDAGRAQSALSAAQSVLPGYLDLAGDYATGASSAMRAMDPAAEELRQGILRRGQEAADRGGLDPASRRRVTQGARSRFARSGRMRGNAAIAGEAVDLDRATVERQAFDTGQASSALSTGAQFDAGRQVAGNLLGDASFANRLSGLTSDAYKVDPWNAYGADVANTNYNAEVSQNMARQNSLAALWSAGYGQPAPIWGNNGSGASLSGGGLDPFQWGSRATRAGQAQDRSSMGRKLANFY